MRALDNGLLSRYLKDNPGFLVNQMAPRLLYSIYVDLNGLSTGQQNSIWTDLDSGSPPKWATDEGDNAAAIMALHWAVANSGASTANINNAKRRLVAMYVQDNPHYLEAPDFDPSINISGEEPV